MSDNQKTTQENQETPFDVASCMPMMEKMMEQQSCDCTGMMSQMAGWQDQGGCAEMMSQMMAMFGWEQGETEEATAAEATQEA